MKMMTLWEAMTTEDANGDKFIDGDVDLYDFDWDWCVASAVDPELSEEEMENYDRFQKWLAQHLVVDVDTIGEYSVECNASELMWTYHKIFDPFFNDHNRAGYRPKSYKKIDPDEDNGFYEVYMCSLSSLIVGNYSEEDYKELCEALNAASHDVTPEDYKEYLAFKEKTENFRENCQCTVYKQAEEEVKDLWKEIQ